MDGLFSWPRRAWTEQPVVYAAVVSRKRQVYALSCPVAMRAWELTGELFFAIGTTSALDLINEVPVKVMLSAKETFIRGEKERTGPLRLSVRTKGEKRRKVMGEKVIRLVFSARILWFSSTVL